MDTKIAPTLENALLQFMLARTPPSRIELAIQNSNSFEDTLTALQESTSNISDIHPERHLDIYLTTLLSSHFVYNFLSILGEESLKPTNASLPFIKFLEVALPLLQKYVSSLTSKEFNNILLEHDDSPELHHLFVLLSSLVSQETNSLSSLYEGLKFNVTF